MPDESNNILMDVPGDSPLFKELDRLVMRLYRIERKQVMRENKEQQRRFALAAEKLLAGDYTPEDFPEGPEREIMKELKRQLPTVHTAEED